MVEVMNEAKDSSCVIQVRYRRKFKAVKLEWHGMLCVDYAYLSSTYVDKDQYEGQYLPGVVG